MVQKSSIIIICLVFLFFQFTLTFGIFFNYDMPRVALEVQNFLKSGSFMTSQSFVQESSWLNIPWGPSLIFFYSVFLKISSDPLIVAHILSVINLFGVLSIFVLGYFIFGPMVGLVASFLLAFNPYWFTYTRIIYQPAPLTIFIPVSMLIFFWAIKTRKPISIILLPLTWTILFQIYIPTYSFIITSLIAFVLLTNRQYIKYLLIGLALSITLVLPTFKFYKENPVYIKRFIEAPSRFTPHEKDLAERIKNVAYSYFQIPIGGKFDWQTGYGYEDFIKNYFPGMRIADSLLGILLVVTLAWNIFYSIKNKNINRIVIIAWALCPFWSLIVLRVSDLVPRYFLIAFPSIMILITLFFHDLSQKISIFKYVAFIAPALIAINWIIFNIQYNKFIKEYDYPTGKFQDVAEVPYNFLKGSMDWAVSDSKINNCDNLILSNDSSDLNFNLWMESEYVWKFLYKRQVDKDNVTGCHYVIIFNSQADELGIQYLRFGPLAVFRYD